MKTRYSELMGSFIRTGNYPIEANYIFENKEALEGFYSQELNVTTLHKGLLKIVEQDEDGKQALYWVTKKRDSDELEFTKLISANNTQELFERLAEVESKLNLEIKKRQEADKELWGTENPNEIDEDLNSILDLAEAVAQLRQVSSELKNELKAVVGTEEDDIIEYLKTLPYQSLTEIADTLDIFLNQYDEEEERINTLPELQDFLEGFSDKDKLLDVLLNIVNDIMGDPYPSEDFRTLRNIEDFVRLFKSLSEYTDANLQTEINQTQQGVGLDSDGKFSPDITTNYLKDAKSVMNALRILDSLINEAINNVNLQPGETDSTKINIIRETDKTTIYADVKLADNSDIQINNGGLYHKVDSEYKDGILTIKVNGETRQTHVLGLSTIVESAEYDPNQESIIIVFKLQSGDTLKVTIPAGALISEWEVDNSQSDKVVELTKVRNTGPGSDKLSADVRLSSDKYNILKKDGNTLFVDGRASNIIFDGEVTVESKINELVLKDSNQLTQLDNLNQSLSDEVSRAQNAEKELSDQIVEINHTIELNQLLINNKFEQVKNSIDGVNSSLLEETNRAKETEQSLANDILKETSRAQEAETVLNERYNDLQEQVQNFKYEPYIFALYQLALDAHVGAGNTFYLANDSTDLSGTMYRKGMYYSNGGDSYTRLLDEIDLMLIKAWYENN